MFSAKQQAYLAKTGPKYMKLRFRGGQQDGDKRDFQVGYRGNRYRRDGKLPKDSVKSSVLHCAALASTSEKRRD